VAATIACGSGESHSEIDWEEKGAGAALALACLASCQGGSAGQSLQSFEGSTRLVGCSYSDSGAGPGGQASLPGGRGTGTSGGCLCVLVLVLHASERCRSPLKRASRANHVAAWQQIVYNSSLGGHWPLVDCW
jgi:hypothetical protein